MPAAPSPQHDVIVAGGGPSGATAALLLARHGFRVLVAERSRFPRFRLGESLLPANTPLLRRLGVAERLRQLPHTTKRGVEFGLGHLFDTSVVEFRDAFGPQESAFNVERAAFDTMLLDAAREAGAEVAEGLPLRRIHRLADDDVEVCLGDRRCRARYLLDATGQATVVGKHLGLRRDLAGMERIAYFAHATGVEGLAGERAGFPSILMMRDAWFWSIPLDAQRTSLGVVMDRSAARRLPVPPEQRLQWALARCPLLAHRCRDAVLPERNGVAADFTYRCAPACGPGYFLLGDAATFVDPIFSTGVYLGMAGATAASDGLTEALAGRRSPAAIRRRYRRFVDRSTRPYLRLIQQFYDPAFRDLLLAGAGPLQLHRAVLSLLAGHGVPRPAWRIRWRMALFGLAVKAQHLVPLAPRQSAQSLLSGAGEWNRQAAA
ncbi:MAG: NAD(P)/FAD-dependent oxidoreductase [Acidobacteriota bacterium]